jgi:hypothetical protein
MSAGDAVAIYAALVGTASLAWQIMRARRADNPGVTVTVANAMIGLGDGNADWTLSVKAVNGGGLPVGISGAGLDLQDGSGRTFVMARGFALDSIPGTVQPRHDATAFFPVTLLEQHGFDLTRPVVGFVNLATGDTIRSKPTTLRSD